MLRPSPSRHHDKASAAPGFDTPFSLPETSKLGRDQLAVPDLPSGRDGRPTPLDSPVCLAISWLSPSFVIGQHHTLSPASEPRKDMMSNDDHR
jgi:hypothetical protein